MMQPGCRLLTLTGLGGIGKTQLALHAADRVLPNFSNGIYCVDLSATQASPPLALTMSDAIGFSLSGQAPPKEQLWRYLQSKQCLLLLDNFEHLLERAAFLSRLLHQASQLKLLVTSREALNLQEEWLYPVRGLTFPESPEADNVAACPAVQLFVECARHRRPDFSLTNEATGVVQICQLVEGMPLAIEMAAAWVKTMRCTTIASEIQDNMHFLASTLRNLPERHRSMAAVFEQSWNRLSERQQRVFGRLSVFRGGFRCEAAEQVAGASIAILTALFDKPLLRWEANGRYQIHELLRQYGEAKLEPESRATDELHSAYFVDYLYARLQAMHSKRQLEASAEIETELDNIRKAWDWIVDTGNATAIQKAEQSLYLFYLFQSRYQEGIVAFEHAVRSLDRLQPGRQRDQHLYQRLVTLGWLHIRLGHLEAAEHVLERSQRLDAHVDIPPTGMATHPLIPLAVIAVIKGNYARAVETGNNVRRYSESVGDQGNLMFAHYVLTSATLT
ncbi:MAG: hypothetical protein K8L99_02030 [Anaerolineae bacterium]|nr:hypothetical protein [Anaerolineae bacterium]